MNTVYGMPSQVSEARPEGAIFQVRRPDTLQFSTLEGLTRMAGVSPQWLRALINKEVVDNALDEIDRVGGNAESVTIRRDGDDTYIVEDAGSGIKQDLHGLCNLFSANRSMVSSKFFRRPSRGMLGNGLRVLVGAVALSDGTITVESHGRRTALRPRRFGDTEIISQISAPNKLGTRITYTLGAIIPYDDDLIEAEDAVKLACAAGPTYTRLPSPHWLDADHLAQSFAVIEAAETTVRQLIEKLDGCSGAMAGRIAAPFGKGRTCRSMSDPEIAALLKQMQESARVVKPRALGLIGADAFGEAYDGYIVAEAALVTRTHEPRAHIPVLIEAWANVTSRRGDEAALTLYCNRTPTVGGVDAVHGHGGVYISGACLDDDGDAIMKVEGGHCDLIVAVTSPFIPTTSLGKAPDLSLLQSEIVEALRKAFTRSRNRLPPDPALPKPPKAEPLPKTPKAEPYQPSGPLATFLAEEAARAGCAPRDLFVLSPKHDPFNETKASRRAAEWFTEQVDRLKPYGEVHPRGMYYRCVSAGDVRLPDGTPFVGSNANSQFVEAACKYARHLGLIPFDRIVDERAAPPDFYDRDDRHSDVDASDDPIDRELIVSDGIEPLGVPELNCLVPTLSMAVPKLPRQPFRICLIGEKTSLGEVLRPIAREVRGEMVLGTGEVSEAAVFGICRRAAADKRRLRLLYFSDFDPAGWQMPISVARKLQAHRCHEFPDLDVRLFKVALTVEQVIEFNLPDSPIKRAEKRARAWRERWGREQVEIDALAALRPDLLDQIARAAVAPYFDPTFDRRFAEAMAMPPDLLAWFDDQPAYQQAKASVQKAYTPALRAITKLNAAKAAAVDEMLRIVANDAPDLSDVVVKPEIGDDEPENSIFDSRDDFVTATMKLKALKALDSEEDDEEGAE
ncbi:hypothetical protein [Alloacidobacterium sp.]|uniref:hypothetical protein n=1 Tax=Alloacidobacterium sp. TaxID=2951999 RepID=UPI002D73C095|nr:hypothetical protein [Alloacidobacterium sp.]HYK36873.1 hypothetical protein [Alloacidobacterium sp.]